MPFRHQGGRDSVKDASAASESVLGSGFRCSVGDVSSTIASSALPPGRLIVRVLSGGVRSLKGNATPRRALISSASLARGKKQLREANGRHRSGRCSEGSG